MILISHRGNLNGKSNMENRPGHINKALWQGFDVEIDVWYIDDESVYTTCVGKISISIKKQKKWHSNFLDQLEKNIQSDKTRWGLLVTDAFPNEALNENIWTARTATDRLVLIVKPAFAPVAYFAIRQMVVYEHELQKTVSEKIGSQNLIHCRSINGSSKLIGDKISKTPVEKARREVV